MNISAKESRGVFAECPKCHSFISHGFQVCQTCGYAVSAKEQAGLQKLLAKNILLFSALALFSFCGLFFRRLYVSSVKHNHPQQSQPLAAGTVKPSGFGPCAPR